jgi:cell division protein FtsI (penicillin-binding protein 3)
MGPRVSPPPRPENGSLAVGRRRLRLVAIGFAVAFSSVGLRLVDMVEWQRAAELPQPMLAPAAKAALTVAERKADNPATVGEDDLVAGSRADIVDRNGVVLATNLQVPSVFADPSLFRDKAAAARKLAGILPGVDAAELARRFEGARRFTWVKHRITPEEQRAVLDLGLPGVDFRLTEHRVYPKEELTSHVTGYVDLDNRGLAGIERSRDQRLRGSREPVTLGLDVRVQQIVREELGRAYRRFRAVGANAVVLDRRTGEVLAMVSLPDFDPNRVGDVSRVEYLNRNTAGLYELGSVFKILTIAMALDSGKVSLLDRFDATGKLQIGRFRIGDDHAKNRWLSVPEIFKYSSNIGTARMAFAAGGAQPLEQFFKKIGLYGPPDIEVSEVARPRVPKRWADVTVATSSFGHGIAVTPIQFVDAVAGLIGDGTHIPTTLLRREPGEEVPYTRFVSARTADLMRWLMWLTVEEGTGTKAKLPSYLLGGKTGTAEKAGRGGYSADRVLASFFGAFPIHDPAYVVFVSLDEPQGDAATHGFRTGGWVAAPVVATIIDRIGPLLGVHPTPPEVAEAMRARLHRTQPAAVASGRDTSPKHQPTGRQEASLEAGSALR